MSKLIKLMVIDPQNSFCKVVDPSEQQVIHDGELCVSGDPSEYPSGDAAWQDMAVRLPKMINRLGTVIDDIVATMDSHQRLHIAHPMFWRRLDNGNQPDPFTIMKEDNGTVVGHQFDPAAGALVPVGEFTTIVPSFMEWTDDDTGEKKGALPYLRTLSSLGRYDHCVWPYHCLIGTAGHNIVTPLMDAFNEWEDKHVARGSAAYVQKVTKGSFLFAEHFSAVKAEVPDDKEPSTQMNSDFIDMLMEADEVLLAGEARSHCLANTVRDLADQFAGNDEFIKKCVLLTDCTSDVPGFEHLGTEFVNDMVARGMKTTTSEAYMA